MPVTINKLGSTTLTVTVRVGRVLRYRIFIGVALMRLAGWIMGMTTKMDVTHDL